MPALPTITQAEARRIALAAQGLVRRNNGVPPTARQLCAILDRLGIFQIDSVSVLTRAHYLPLFSRLGAYDRTLFDEAAWGRKRRWFEYWGHEASLLPFALHPLLRWRMAEAARGEMLWPGLADFQRGHQIISKPSAPASLRKGLSSPPISKAPKVSKAGGAGATPSARWKSCSGPVK